MTGPWQKYQNAPADGPWQKYAAPAEPEKQSVLGGLVDSFTKGVTFGFGDELTALEAAILGKQAPDAPDQDWFNYERPFWTRYQEALDAERAQNRQFETDNPGLSTAAEIAGTGAATVIPGIAAMRASRGASLPGKMAAGSGLGAAEGALYGAGVAEGRNPMDWTGDIVKHGAIGGAAGAAIPVLARGAGKVWQGVKGGLVDPLADKFSSAGAQRLRRDMMAELLAPDDLAKRATDFPDDAVIGDLTESGRTALDDVAHGASDARIGVVETMRGRTGKAAQARVLDFYDETVGKRVNAVEYLDGIKSRMKDIGKTGYEPALAKAKAVDISDALKVLDEELSTPFEKMADPKSAISETETERLFRWAQKQLTDGKSVLTDARKIHDIQSKIGKKAMSLRGKDDYARGVLMDARRKLQKALNKAAPGYDEARKKYAAEFDIQDAFDDGFSIFKGGNRIEALPEWWAKRFKEASKAEQDAMRLGVRVAIDGKLKGVRTGVLSPRNILDVDYNAEKLAAVLGDDGAAKVMRRMEAEAKMAETAKRTLPTRSSDTAGREARREAQGSGMEMVDDVKSFFDFPWRKSKEIYKGHAGRRAHESAAEIYMRPASEASEIARLLQQGDARFRSGEMVDEATRRVLMAALLAGGPATVDSF